MSDQFEAYSEVVGGDRIVRLEAARSYARAQGILPRQAEIEFLSHGIVPYRYIGNVRLFGFEGQKTLLRTKVCVIGCGGLGGSIIELLARLGIGSMVIADPDVFEEHNLNRQLMSSEADLGKPKVDCAKRRVACINSVIEVQTHQVYAGADNMDTLLKGCDIAMDALDNIESRHVLERACAHRGIPMVHGAIGDAQIQVAVVSGAEKMAKLYGDSPRRGIKGNPAPTVMMCAALQAAEAVKVLTGFGETLKQRVLLGDWMYLDFQTIDVR